MDSLPRSRWSRQLDEHIEVLRLHLKAHPELWEELGTRVGSTRRLVGGFAGRWNAWQNPRLSTMKKLADTFTLLLREQREKDEG